MSLHDGYGYVLPERSIEVVVAEPVANVLGYIGVKHGMTQPEWQMIAGENALVDLTLLRRWNPIFRGTGAYPHDHSVLVCASEDKSNAAERLVVAATNVGVLLRDRSLLSGRQATIYFDPSTDVLDSDWIDSLFRRGWTTATDESRRAAHMNAATFTRH